MSYGNFVKQGIFGCCEAGFDIGIILSFIAYKKYFSVQAGKHLTLIIYNDVLFN